MKSSKSNNQKINSIIIGVSLSFTALFIASCQKDEPVRPYSQNNSSDLKQADPAGASFTFIEIDHYAENTSLPEYSVKVNALGQVVFDGKKNVAFKGLAEFKIPTSAVNELGELFLHSNFMTMTHDAEFSPDLPINATTYAINRGPIGPKTHLDNNLNPAELVSLRNKVESLLNISKYIIKSGPQTASASTIEVN